MKLCPNCKRQNEEAAKNCAGCGLKLESQPLNRGKELVYITLAFWFLTAFLSIAITKHFQSALWPLFGLYPAEDLSGKIDYNSTDRFIWGISTAAVFIVLAVLAVCRKSTTAGVAFLILFLLSVIVPCVKILHNLQNIH